jgi:hypothetical protein
MAAMDPHERRRQQIITELSRLSPGEFDSLLAEVRGRRGAEAAGVEALRAAFAARAAASPFSPLAGLLSEAEE